MTPRHNVTTSPLREVVDINSDDGPTLDVLSCGHRVPQRSDHPRRRRCPECKPEAVGEKTEAGRAGR